MFQRHLRVRPVKAPSPHAPFMPMRECNETAQGPFRRVYREQNAGSQPLRGLVCDKKFIPAVVFTPKGRRYAAPMEIDLNGCRILKGTLDRTAQEALVGDLRTALAIAPLRRLTTRGGKPMSVAMSAAGQFGWHSDARGYRYITSQPSGEDWPPIPARVLALWQDITGAARAPECCLINYYNTSARMGLHQDKDEADFRWPVLSISLGDSAVFRVGGLRRSDPTRSVLLESGDIALLSGPARRAFHGIDRLRGGSSKILPEGGRFNLTCRVVT